MAKRGKKYRRIEAQLAEHEGPFELAGAIQFIKANPGAAFDETVEISMLLGVDPKKSDQSVRGTLTLPHGTGREQCVVVFATGAQADAAREAGASDVGFEDLIEKVKGGWTDFDIAIATPEAMQEVRKLGKVLGPRGLMPNPKVGTVTDDVATAVQQAKAGRLEYRMDRQGNVHVPVGKVSFSPEQLVENAEVVLAAIQAAKPSAAKGTYMKRCSISSTMGVGIRIVVRDAA